MIKVNERSKCLGRVAARNLTIAEPRTDWFPHRTFEGLRDDLEIRRLLQRALESEKAPLSLIEAIKKGIRR